MKKTPFNTPQGNRSGISKSGSDWTSYDPYNNRGYGQKNMSCPVYASTSSGETSTSDYIPFTSTPSSYQCRNSSPTAHHNRKQMTNLYGGRGGRNKTPRIYNDHRSSRGSWNPFSPYDNRRDHHRIIGNQYRS